MSKNTNIADLINYISVDGSGNVIFSSGQLVATQNYVTTAVSNLVASAPSTLDTLNELAAALGNDANFATTVTTSIGTKVPQTRTITINGTTLDLSADRSFTVAGGLTSFNTRTGAITLTSSDVTTALGFTPYNSTNPSAYITSSALSSYLPLTGGTVSNTTSAGTPNVLTIKNNTNVDNGYAYSTLALDTTLANTMADIRLGSATPLGIRIYAATSPLTVSPTGAGFQLFTNSHPSFSGQVYFDSGAHNSAALIFRTTTTGGNITERFRISSSGLSTFTKTDSSYGLARFVGSTTEASIGFRFPADGDAASWVIGKGAGTGTATFGFYYGATKMTLTTGGNLGLGIDVPTDYSGYTTLHINGKSGGNSGTVRITAFDGSAGFNMYSVGAAQFNTTSAVPFIFLTRDTERIRITDGGNVGIGTSSPGVSLHVNGTIWATRIGGTNATPPIQVRGGGGGPRIQTYGLDADSNAWMGLGTDMAGNPYEHSLYFSNAGGGIGRQTIGSYNGTTYTVKMTILDNGSIGAPTGTNIYNPSDVRLKQNIVTLTDGLNKIMGLNPVKFNWVEEFISDEQDKDMLGFIAQEVQNIVPEAVEGFSDGSSITVGELIIENPLRVNEKFIIPVLVKAIQELKAENDELREILNRNNII